MLASTSAPSPLLIFNPQSSAAAAPPQTPLEAVLLSPPQPSASSSLVSPSPSVAPSLTLVGSGRKSSIAPPPPDRNPSDAASRFHKNLAYFCVNYVALLAAALALSLLGPPSHLPSPPFLPLPTHL